MSVIVDVLECMGKMGRPVGGEAKKTETETSNNNKGARKTADMVGRVIEFSVGENLESVTGEIIDKVVYREKTTDVNMTMGYMVLLEDGATTRVVKPNHVLRIVPFPRIPNITKEFSAEELEQIVKELNETPSTIGNYRSILSGQSNPEGITAEQIERVAKPTELSKDIYPEYIDGNVKEINNKK